MTTLIAHVSDTHLGGPPDARARAAAVLAHLLALDPRPDILLVTGDIADHGLPDEYAEARLILDTWPGPKLVGTGNHDVREAFARGLLDREATGPILQVLESSDLRILMLDSLVAAPVGERIDHGELDLGQLNWLDEQLAAHDTPTFVALHHPAADLGLSLMAPILLRDPERLELVIRKHPHVIATLVGHAHTASATTFAGRPLLIGGGCASTVPLDNEPYPVVWEAGPPTLAFHLLHDDGRLTTHWRALPFPRRRLMLLSFDTATPLVTVALHDGADVVCELVSERRLQHGEQLAPLIERALRDTGLVRQDLTAIGVGVGPGPFTGLRVGLVTARTLGFVLDIPVYGVCTLDVLAVEAVDTGAVTGDLVVATDARRKEVYLASYDETGGRLDGPEVAKPADVATDAPVVGEGAVLYPDAFPHAAGPTMPSAGWLARVITEERAELYDPEPLYLRRPDAAAPGTPKRVS